MTRDEVIRLVGAQRAELARLGARSVSLFGSAARGELSETSDVDVLVEFDGATTLSGYMRVKSLLESVLGRRVDLVTPRALKPRLRAAIERELVRVA